MAIRAIRPQDKPLLEQALRQLSPQSQYARFLSPKPRLTAGELRYLTEIDGDKHCALVAVLLDDPRRLVAVARYVRQPDDPQTAEMAIVVADAFQGQGLGRRLGLLLAEHGRSHGVRRFTGLMLSDNLSAHGLFAAIARHMSTSHHDGGVDEVVAELAA